MARNIPEFTADQKEDFVREFFDGTIPTVLWYDVGSNKGFEKSYALELDEVFDGTSVEGVEMEIRPSRYAKPTEGILRHLGLGKGYVLVVRSPSKVFGNFELYETEGDLVLAKTLIEKPSGTAGRPYLRPKERNTRVSCEVDEYDEPPRYLCDRLVNFKTGIAHGPVEVKALAESRDLKFNLDDSVKYL